MLYERATVAFCLILECIAATQQQNNDKKVGTKKGILQQSN